jgi:hypothetical protein
MARLRRGRHRGHEEFGGSDVLDREFPELAGHELDLVAEGRRMRLATGAVSDRPLATASYPQGAYSARHRA